MGSASAATANTVPSPPSPAVDALLKPRRANSDKALPRLVPFRSASARATARTSLSMVMVVRISASSHISIIASQHQLVNPSGLKETGPPGPPRRLATDHPRRPREPSESLGFTGVTAGDLPRRVRPRHPRRRRHVALNDRGLAVVARRAAGTGLAQARRLGRTRPRIAQAGGSAHPQG